MLYIVRADDNTNATIQTALWLTLMLLYRPRSVAIFLLALHLGLHTSGASQWCAVKVVSVGNCYIYQMCFFGGFVKHNCICSVDMNSSISYYRPVIVLFMIFILQKTVAHIYNRTFMVHLTVHIWQPVLDGTCWLLECNGTCNGIELMRNTL